MSLIKRAKDHLIKALLTKSAVPSGLAELFRYTRNNGSINFQFENKDGLIIARSTNFRWGSIITSGRNEMELDKNIKDAILTSFEIPSSYAGEAKIEKVGSASKEYAPA